MITVKDADKIIEENIKPFPTVELPLEKAYGTILHEDIRADRDLPPFAKSLMDGVAIKLDSYSKGNRVFTVEGIQSAGIAALKLKSENGCTEIMTGGVLTKGADCVIPVEQVSLKNGTVTIEEDLVLQRCQNIRSKGADHKKGEVLIKKGTFVKAPQIAIAASVGKATIKVNHKPKIAVISTGDEIVDIHEDIKPYQIRQSNSYFIKSALDQTGMFVAEKFHFPDNVKILRRQLAALLEQSDVLILTGGVSMGKFDYVPQVLSDLNVKVLFHKVKQKPGKPFWFGKSSEGKPVFALPGNPQSTQIGTYRYVIKHLFKACGQEKKTELIRFKNAFELNTKFSFFLPVKVTSTQKAICEAIPIKTGGSGDLASLGQSDGFVEIPAEHETVPAGFIGQFYRW